MGEHTTRMNNTNTQDAKNRMQRLNYAIVNFCLLLHEYKPNAFFYLLILVIFRFTNKYLRFKEMYKKKGFILLLINLCIMTTKFTAKKNSSNKTRNNNK